MISLTRLSGSVFLVNADLVERVDETPDTVVTLVDGKKYVVTETLDEVRERVIDYRAEIVARSTAYDVATWTAERAGTRRVSSSQPVHLSAVRTDGSPSDHGGEL